MYVRLIFVTVTDCIRDCMQIRHHFLSSLSNIQIHYLELWVSRMRPSLNDQAG